jgi:diguanylate cyclase (GGDEF)-like protein
MSATDHTQPPRGPLLSSEVRAALSRFGTSQDLARGSVIFRKGSRGKSMYVIDSGTVDLLFDQTGRQDKSLGAGDFFGELALLTGDHLRAATATAATDVQLWVIDQEGFDQLLRWAPQLAVELLRTSCLYLLGSEQALTEELTRRNRELSQTLDYLRRTKEDLDATELLALTDELTGLYNRRCLHQHSEMALRNAASGGCGLALILIDIDHFKGLNDTWGHPVGDLVLKRLASLLRDSLRHSDLPCRLGGDEFAVLLAELDPTEAEATARRLLVRVAALDLRLAGEDLRVTCSIGGTAFQPGETWDAFFERADRSLYLAKEHGRNCAAWDDRILEG